MSQVYVNGPAEIHVTTGAGGTFEFLGWGVQGVRIDIVGQSDDVPSDVAGSKIPFDVQAMGAEAYISTDLSVYNEGIYRKIANRVRMNDAGPAASAAAAVAPSNAAAGEGVMPQNSMGFLMMREQAAGMSGAFGLLVFAPYGGGTGGANKGNFATMDHGYRFHNAYLDDAATLEVGTRYKKIRVVFRTINTITMGAAGYGYTLYDHVTSGRVGIN